jgi:hypothetical protein
VVHAPINVNAPTVDREMFNSLVASPDPKDKAANMAPAPSPNDNVPPPPDDDLLLNLVDEGDVDMVSLADLCLRTCVFLRFYHSQLISFTYHRTSSYSTNQVVQLKPLLLRSRYLTIMVKLNPIQKTLSNFTYSPTILTEAT